MRTLVASVLVVVLATLFASEANAQYYYGRRGWRHPRVVVAAPVVAYPPYYGPAYAPGYGQYGPAVVVAPPPVVVVRPRHHGWRRWRRW